MKKKNSLGFKMVPRACLSCVKEKLMARCRRVTPYINISTLNVPCL